MNIGESQIRGALFNFFVVKKCPFLHLPDAAPSFYNYPCINPLDAKLSEKDQNPRPPSLIEDELICI